jgi:low affinity Fe/Cu permease
MRWFDRFAKSITQAAGSPIAVTTAVLVVLLWAVSGPFFGFSDTWQLIINTATTILTFIMVFLIQATQNRDNRAFHIKLDEIIGGQESISNRAVAVEEATIEDLGQLHEEHLAHKEKKDDG